jgi:hypothetical protein
MFTSLQSKRVALALTLLLAAAAELALANPPPPRQRDPISLDPFSPSNAFGTTWADLYGDNPMPPGMGFDIGGPGPVLHVFAPAYGVLPMPDDTDALSNGEFGVNRPQVIYFSVDDLSQGLPGTPVRNQALRGQQAGDRYVLNGVSSTTPAAGPFPAVRVGGLGGPRHLLSANQTVYNEIPSIPPGAFNVFPAPAGFTVMDDMDALELNPIDLNGDGVHDTWLYFSLAPGSPTLGMLGALPGDLLVAPPRAPVAGIYALAGQMGLQPADDIDAVAVFESGGNRRVANPGVDRALFSLARNSPSLRGPDGVAGTADDISPADVLITSFAGNFAVFMRASQLGLQTTDNIDALDVEPFARPEVFDWWVQRFNIDLVFVPPPGWPPLLPANDIHIVLPGLDVEQVFDLWTGSFPSASVVATADGVIINWSGRDVPAGQTIHIGWTISDTTTLPGQMLQFYWTRDGVPLPQPLPDNVQRWTWDGSQTVIDRLPNFSTEPVLVQRRVRQSTETVGMADLMRGSAWWNAAQLIDPAPMPLMPDSFFDVFFNVEPPGAPQTRTYSVMYDVFNTQGTRLATHLNALTMIRTPELENEGACCLGTACEVASEEFCLAWGGRFLGLGTSCDGLVCTPIVLRGDLNCDNTVNFGDINPFVMILTNPSGWQETYFFCPFLNGDINGDGAVSFGDINPFVTLLTHP